MSEDIMADHEDERARARRLMEENAEQRDRAIQTSMQLLEQSLDAALGAIDHLKRLRPDGLSHEEKGVILTMEVMLGQALHVAVYLSQKSSDPDLGKRFVAVERAMSRKLAEVVP